MSAKRASPKQRTLDESTPVQELARLANQSIELARLVARNAAAPEALLETLGSHSDATVRKWVTSNPNTPAKVLLKLAQQFPEQLLDNPILDLLFLENPNLFADMPIGTVRALMKRPTTPVWFIRNAMERGDEGVELAIAQNRATPADIIENLKSNGATAQVRQTARAWERADTPTDQAEGLFWEEVCERIGELGPRKGERKVFIELLARDIANMDRATWVHDWRRANDPATREAELSAMAQTDNSLIQYALIGRNLLRVALLRLAARAKPVHLRRLAADKKAFPEVLDLLARSPDKETRCAVARHLKAPGVALELLAQDSERDVRASLTGNPGTIDWPVSKRLLLAKKGLCRLTIVQENQRPFGLSGLLRRLASDKDCEIRETVAKNRFTPVAVLGRLASDNDWEVRAAVAKNRFTPVAVLERLSKDECEDVFYEVGANPRTPLRALRKLSRDKDALRRRGVAFNPNAPPQLLKCLAEDDVAGVRWLVASNPSLNSSVLQRLATDPDSAVRAAVAENPNTSSSLLKLLATDPEPRVRGDVAGNRRVPIKVLENLANDKNPFVRSMIARNSRAPTQQLEKLAKDRERYVREYVAENPKTSPSVLEYLARDKERDVRAMVAANPAAPANLLRRLGKSSERCGYKVASNPSAPLDLLEFLATTHDDDDGTLAAVAENPNSPAELLERLATDKFASVREAAAAHRSIPERAWERLLWDEDLLVVECAAGNSMFIERILEELRETLRPGGNRRPGAG